MCRKHLWVGACLWAIISRSASLQQLYSLTVLFLGSNHLTSVAQLLLVHSPNSEMIFVYSRSVESTLTTLETPQDYLKLWRQPTPPPQLHAVYGVNPWIANEQKTGVQVQPLWHQVCCSLLLFPTAHVERNLGFFPPADPRHEIQTSNLCIYLLEMREKEKRERNLCSGLFHKWIKQPGMNQTKALPWSPMWMAGFQAVGPSSATFPNKSAGNSIRSGAAGLQLVLICYGSVIGSDLVYHTTARVPKLNI